MTAHKKPIDDIIYMQSLGLSINLEKLIQPNLDLGNLVQQNRNSLGDQFLWLILTSRLDVI
jgi:hypothetical protein